MPSTKRDYYEVLGVPKGASHGRRYPIINVKGF
jgi:hypothetical protein